MAKSRICFRISLDKQSRIDTDSCEIETMVFSSSGISGVFGVGSSLSTGLVEVRVVWT